MNGFETARIIKSRERSRYIPIIFLTAISKEEEYVFKGYSVGAVDYLFKPFKPTSCARRSRCSWTCTSSSSSSQQQEQLLREASGASSSCSTCASSWSRRRASRDDRRLGDGRDHRVRRRRPHHAVQRGGRADVRRDGARRGRHTTCAASSRADARRTSLRPRLRRPRTTAEARARREPPDARPIAHRACAPSGEEFPIEASVSLPRRCAASARTR